MVAFQDSDDCFRYLMRVRYGECDAQGIVFNARYGDYIDIAATEFVRAVWGGPKQLLAVGYDYQVVKQTKEWLSPARFDDVLEARVKAGRIGTTSFTLAMEFSDNGTGRPVLLAETVYVLVSVPDYAKVRVPEDMRAKLLDGAPGRVVDHAGAGPMPAFRKMLSGV
ncbi:acyl-CoA thioesterase [Aerophototrophica crusticola]|uniref:Acyl-CoA thioesterase n=1 Tax=Aerophototrophica crusticola TaxID=1709002 RepID=A0A858R7S8_9PROT|nr:acyl-CoA thioesterase [Rhodospirillaceae bacterium B3]